MLGSCSQPRVSSHLSPVTARPSEAPMWFTEAHQDVSAGTPPAHMLKSSSEFLESTIYRA